jgi:carnitine 3-dehydrogenase
MGTNLIYHLAGGESGMRHMLAQFGPCLKWPWTKLEAPELSEQLIDRMVEGTAAQAAGRSIRDLERLRDDSLVAIQQTLRQFNIGAGATLRALEERLYRDAPAPQIADGGPLRLLETVVRSEWIDYNHHLTDFRYGQLFGDAMDALYRKVGVDAAYRAGGHMYYSVESHVRHIGQAREGESLYVTVQLLKVDEKRLHVFHRLHRGRDDALIATGEQMHLHVDTAAEKSSAVDPDIRARLESILQSQAALPRPAEAGRSIGRAP